MTMKMKKLIATTMPTHVKIIVQILADSSNNSNYHVPNKMLSINVILIMICNLKEVMMK